MTYEAPRWLQRPPPRDIGMTYAPGERRVLRNQHGAELEIVVFSEALTRSEFDALRQQCQTLVVHEKP